MKYYWLKLAEFLSRVFPRRVGYGIARRIADGYVLFDRQGRENVIRNLARIHAHSGVTLSRRALRVLARENFLNFAKYLVDFFHFLHLEPARARRLIDFGNARAVHDELLARGKGVIFLSAHLGNWELGAAAIAQLGYKLNAVALWQPDPKLNALYQSYRTARCINPIPFGKAARGCLAALKRNETVALVGDRDYSGARDTFAFFGQPARLPTGPAKLALATGAAILPIVLVRRPDDTFAFVTEPPIIPDPTRDTVEDIMRRVTGTLERIISAHSEQWYLFHDLWNIEEDRALAKAAAFGSGPEESGKRQGNGGEDDEPATTLPV